MGRHAVGWVFDETRNVSEPSAPEIRSGRVLVIDDEPMLARIIAELLSDTYDVEVATHGKEAIDRILAGGRYDVIFCDVSMPGIHGLDVHAAVARARPEQAARFVFMSGGVSDPVLWHRLEALPNLLVEKPCACHRLREIVTERCVGARPSGLISGAAPPRAAG